MENLKKESIELTKEEIRAIRKLLLREQNEQFDYGTEYSLNNPSIEMNLYQLFTSKL